MRPSREVTAVRSRRDQPVPSQSRRDPAVPRMARRQRIRPGVYLKQQAQQRRYQQPGTNLVESSHKTTQNEACLIYRRPNSEKQSL